jgi:exopolysaccharide biosynthesis polyprenyl glycosylphosphotransferase
MPSRGRGSASVAHSRRSLRSADLPALRSADLPALRSADLPELEIESPLASRHHADLGSDSGSGVSNGSASNVLLLDPPVTRSETAAANAPLATGQAVAFPDGSLADGDIVYEVFKRGMDVAGSALGLLIASPLMLVIALLVKLTSRGPIFYSHTRVGKDGHDFTCFKFRTMVKDADKIKRKLQQQNSHNDHRTFKIPDDPRVTAVGRFLRRTSLDELPQLINVLRGEMSLVGPRPALPTEVERYTFDDMQRLDVKPGLTCIWQVSGRSNIAFPEQLEMDVRYIRNRSLWLDCKLIALTIPAVLSADGAY